MSTDVHYARTVFDGIDALSEDHTALITLDRELRPTSMSAGELRTAVEQAAAALIHQHGVAPDDRLGVAVADQRAAVVAVLAIWRAGATAFMIPPAAHTANTDATATRVKAAGASAVVSDGRPMPDGVQVIDSAALQTGAGGAVPPPPGPERVALLQATSGTTAAPKFAPVTHGQLFGNAAVTCLDATAEAGETFVTWVPMYHSLGLASIFGCLAYGLRVVMMDLTTFLQRPQSWLDALTEYQAHHTLGSHFAFPLVETFLRADPGRFDLSRLKLMLDTTEPIDVATMGSFLQAAEKAGLRRDAFSPGYGLTEATMAVTFSRPGEEPWTLSVRRDSLRPGERIVVGEPDAESRTLPSLGRAVDGSAVVVTDEDGRPLDDGVVGEVRVTGPQVVREYLPQAGRTLPPTVDDRGRLMTGDLGFVHRGELFLCGRAKEMIIVGGENFYAEDYEAVVEQVPGVIPGGAAAFAGSGERMVVIAELGADPAAAGDITAAIKTAIRKAFGHRPAAIVAVPFGTLPRTPSGKRQRHESRRRYEEGTLTVLHERS